MLGRVLCSHHSRSEVKTMNTSDSCRIVHVHTEDRSQMLAGGSRLEEEEVIREVSSSEY